MPLESAIVLVLLRWPSEVRGLDSLELPKEATDVKLSKSELDMAKRLIKDMSTEWTPDAEEYRDTFQDQIMSLVETKAREGKIENVETDAGDTERKSADVIDLTELLKRSLGGRGSAAKAAPAKAKPASKSKTESKDDAPAKRRAPPRKKTTKAS